MPGNHIACEVFEGLRFWSLLCFRLWLVLVELDKDDKEIGEDGVHDIVMHIENRSRRSSRWVQVFSKFPRFFQAKEKAGLPGLLAVLRHVIPERALYYLGNWPSNIVGRPCCTILGISSLYRMYYVTIF